MVQCTVAVDRDLPGLPVEELLSTAEAEAIVDISTVLEVTI